MTKPHHEIRRDMAPEEIVARADAALEDLDEEQTEERVAQALAEKARAAGEMN